MRGNGVRRRKALIGVAAGLAAVCAGGGIYGAAKGLTWLLGDQPEPGQACTERDAAKLPAEKMGAVAELGWLVLPDGCQWLDGYREAWIEWQIAARFLIPAGALEAFVRDSKLAAPVPGLRPEAITREHPASKCDSQWQPRNPAKVSGIETEDLVTVTRTLMLDLDRPETITVYLMLIDTDVSASPTPAGTSAG